jgi:hypothetical protein
MCTTVDLTSVLSKAIKISKGHGCNNCNKELWIFSVSRSIILILCRSKGIDID